MHRRGELDARSSVGICWLLSPFPHQYDLSGLPVLRICGRPTKPASCLDPSVPAKHPPSGPGWVHELKHDGYRLLIHVRNGRVRLYTMNANDWTKRYPRIVE